MDMRKWIQHTVRSDSQPMSSSPDELQLQKTSILDRVYNKETVVTPDDLGADRPKQVRLHKYLATLFRETKRYFPSAWYEKWDWLECSVKVDAAFCYPWRKFSSRRLFQSKGRRVDQAFTLKGIVTGNTQQKPKKASPSMLIRKIIWRVVSCGKKKKIAQQTAKKFPHYSIHEFHLFLMMAYP